MYRYVWRIELYANVTKDEFISYWRETSKTINSYDGSLGAHAHQVRNDEKSLFMIADWESADDRDAMSNDIHNGNSDRAKKWRSLPKDTDFGIITRFAGEEIEKL